MVPNTDPEVNVVSGRIRLTLAKPHMALLTLVRLPSHMRQPFRDHRSPGAGCDLAPTTCIGSPWQIRRA